MKDEIKNEDIHELEVRNSKKALDILNSDNNLPYCYWCKVTPIEEEHFLQSEFIRKGHETPMKFCSCSAKHELKVLKYYRFVNQFYFLYYLFIFFVPLVLIILSIILKSFVFIFGLFMSMGLGLIILPLIGNQIIVNIGLKKANSAGRILGGTLILIGLTLLFINGWQIFRIN